VRLRLALLLGLACVPPAAAQARLQAYQTKYYILHTDLPEEEVQEANVRITLMAEEFHRRTRGFAGEVNGRLPFYLFRRHRDYVAAGGDARTVGCFAGDKLMAATMPSNPAATWHVVQHEGFHQFIVAAVGRGIPIWANEGLAEYFGQGLFTGDDFVVGLIPPDRLARLKGAIQGGRLQSLRSMLALSHETWNATAGVDEYDQAWAMVQFLGHAHDNKYQKAFIAFLKDVAREVPAERAWQHHFGTDVMQFQQQWNAYWCGLDEHPTRDLYARAVAEMLTSFYARACAQRQAFDDWSEFFAAASAGQLRSHKQDWLPPRLLADAVAAAPLIGEWQLARRPGERLVRCTTAWGTQFEGKF
jgi:hypothetical protein